MKKVPSANDNSDPVTESIPGGATPREDRASWRIPDARDGLTHKERVVLQVLAEAQKERGGRDVPMVMLYGRVVEKIDMSPQELMEIVKRLQGRTGP
jgi:hypothetical protein